jgi:spermidine/putrescine transport system substrate-binding protein
MIYNNENLAFYYPKNENGDFATNIFADAMCIPTGIDAENKEHAEAYINFMLSEEPAIANAEYIYYASPHANVYNNPDYIADMGEDVIEILYPEDFDFHANYNANCYKDLPSEMKDYLNSLWNELVTSQ